MQLKWDGDKSMQNMSQYISWREATWKTGKEMG